MTDDVDRNRKIEATLAAMEFVLAANTVTLLKLVSGVTGRKSKLADRYVANAEAEASSTGALRTGSAELIERRNAEIRRLIESVKKQLD